MLIELFNMILSGAVGWGVGKVLDVMVSCDTCYERFPERIGNVQANTLGCPNCHKEIVQFTNACDFTIQRDQSIGHVKGQFLGGWVESTDPSDQKNYPGWLFFYTAMRAMDMPGKQFVLTGQISDYNTGLLYTTHDLVYTAVYPDTRWYDNSRLPLKWHDIPESCRDYRVFTVDLLLKSRYGDVLYQDRLLAQFEGWR